MNNDKENNYNNENSGCDNFIGCSILVIVLATTIFLVLTGIQKRQIGVDRLLIFFMKK